MINGRVGLMLTLGAIVAMVVCIFGTIALALLRIPTPDDLRTVEIALLVFLFGSAGVSPRLPPGGGPDEEKGK